MKSGKKCHACRGPKLFRQRREGTRGSLDRKGRSSVSRPRSRHLTGTEQMISANIRRAPRMSWIGGGKPRSELTMQIAIIQVHEIECEDPRGGLAILIRRDASPAVTRVRPAPPAPAIRALASPACRCDRRRRCAARRRRHSSPRAAPRWYRTRPRP